MWHTHPAFAIAIGGILPFGAVCIELFFIMSALWMHQVGLIWSPTYPSDSFVIVRAEGHVGRVSGSIATIIISLVGGASTIVLLCPDSHTPSRACACFFAVLASRGLEGFREMCSSFCTRGFFFQTLLLETGWDVHRRHLSYLSR